MAWPTKTDFVDGDVLTAAQVNNIGTNLNLANPTGITDGYVLTADGSNSMGWEAINADSMTVIASGNLPTASANFSFTSIPQTYKKLVLFLNDFRVATSGQVRFRINNDTGTQYTNALTYITSATPTYTTSALNDTYAYVYPVSSATSQDHQAILEISQYTQTSLQYWRAWAGGHTGGSKFSSFCYGTYMGTPAAITQLDFNLSGGNYASGTYVLYGVK